MISSVKIVLFTLSKLILNFEIIEISIEKMSALPYLGKNDSLKNIGTNDKLEKRIEFDNHLFTIYSSKKEITRDSIIRSLYNDWLNSKADRSFKEKLSQYSKIINVTPNRVIIKI